MFWGRSQNRSDALTSRSRSYPGLGEPPILHLQNFVFPTAWSLICILLDSVLVGLHVIVTPSLPSRVPQNMSGHVPCLLQQLTHHCAISLSFQRICLQTNMTILFIYMKLKGPQEIVEKFHRSRDRVGKSEPRTARTSQPAKKHV